MVIFMTSSSSSKTDFICFFRYVCDAGGLAGSSPMEVSHLHIIGIPPLPLLNIASRCLDSPCRHLSNKLEFARFGVHLQNYGSFGFDVCAVLHIAVVPVS